MVMSKPDAAQVVEAVSNHSSEFWTPPGGAVHLTDACRGQDQWQNDLAHRLKECGVIKLGEPIGSGQCMAERQGVTASCGRCLGMLIQCGALCAGQCCMGSCPAKRKCIDCNKAKCQTNFEKCAGVTPSYWE